MRHEPDPEGAVNPNRFDLATLRLFVAVVDGGSLTAGARAHGISLAAASKRIAEVEAAVSARLLERGRFGVRPTAAGQTLYGHAQQVAADVAQLAAAMGDYARGVRGHVRLRANTSAVTGFLPATLSAFLADNADVAVDLSEDDSAGIVRAVETGAADLGVFADNVPTGALSVAVCDEDRLVVVAPRGHALARRRSARFEEVVAHDFIGLDRGSALMRQFNAAADALGRGLRLRVQVRSFDAVSRMVAAGLGVAVLPSSVASVHGASMGLHMLPLADAWAARRLLVGWRTRETLDRPALALLALLEARVVARPPGLARPVRAT